MNVDFEPLQPARPGTSAWVDVDSNLDAPLSLSDAALLERVARGLDEDDGQLFVVSRSHPTPGSPYRERPRVATPPQQRDRLPQSSRQTIMPVCA